MKRWKQIEETTEYLKAQELIRQMLEQGRARLRKQQLYEGRRHDDQK
jgi:hypothetical protein